MSTAVVASAIEDKYLNLFNSICQCLLYLRHRRTMGGNYTNCTGRNSPGRIADSLKLKRITLDQRNTIPIYYRNVINMASNRY